MCANRHEEGKGFNSRKSIEIQVGHRDLVGSVSALFNIRIIRKFPKKTTTFSKISSREVNIQESQMAPMAGIPLLIMPYTTFSVSDWFEMIQTASAFVS